MDDVSKRIRLRTVCRLCGSDRIVKSVPLAQVPIVSPNVGTGNANAQERLTHIVAPLDNYLCQDCGLIQLLHVVDPELIYSGYLYRTSVSLGPRGAKTTFGHGRVRQTVGLPGTGLFYTRTLDQPKIAAALA